MSEFIKIASAEIGTKEITGSTHSERILQYAQDAGFEWYKSDETPWCSVFLNWCAMKAGLERTDSGISGSWLQVGLPITEPEPGDVVVFTGHAGIYMGYSQDKTRIYCLGGNQSNSVNVTAFSTSQLLGFRRLRPDNEPKLPTTPLQRGDYKEEVKILQDALKLAGFNCGTTDGHYGYLTEKAVKDLQESNDSIPVTGIFDQKTKEYLLSMLQLFF